MKTNTVLPNGFTRTTKGAYNRIKYSPDNTLAQAETSDAFSASPELQRAQKFSGSSRPTPLQMAMSIHLNKGFQAIKNGDFEAAIKHFQDKASLKALDVRREWGRFAFAHTTPSTIEEAKYLVLKAAKENMAFNKDGIFSIKFANIGHYGSSPGGRILPQKCQRSSHCKALTA